MAFEAAVARYFAARLPDAHDVEVTRLFRIPGGASRETWSVDLRWLEGNRTERRQGFIVRRDPEASLVDSDRRLLGVITVDELKASEEKMRAEHLAKVDTDHDGKVSDAERKAAFEKFAEERFKKMDKNGDGALSKDEVGDKRWEHLSVADADKNGSVTEAEIRTAVAAGTLKFPHHGRGMHGHGPGGERGPGAGPDAPDAPNARERTETDRGIAILVQPVVQSNRTQRNETAAPGRPACGIDRGGRRQERFGAVDGAVN